MQKKNSLSIVLIVAMLICGTQFTQEAFGGANDGTKQTPTKLCRSSNFIVLSAEELTAGVISTLYIVASLFGTLGYQIYRNASCSDLPCHGKISTLTLDYTKVYDIINLSLNRGGRDNEKVSFKISNVHFGFVFNDWVDRLRR